MSFKHLKIARVQEVAIADFNPEWPSGGESLEKIVECQDEIASSFEISGVEPRKLEHDDADLIFVGLAGMEKTRCKEFRVEEIRIGFSCAGPEST